ncbi:hypothetical protein [Bradyrhizobium sp. Gha]|uniref:hypothetical protein n=1 Tax=Bradyrhizobium sp. Gha TaxID=1855318 RepID=UPI001160C92F|nr:hypothetical protein [Bradyrhizobium sp. Gha]
MRAARSRFAMLLDRLTELQAGTRAPSGRISRDSNPGNRGYVLAGAAEDLTAIVTVMDRMVGELLLESTRSLASVGQMSSNVRQVNFRQRRLLGGRKQSDPSAAVADETVRRTTCLMISLLEVVTTLEEAVTELHPLKAAERADNR